MLLKFKTLSNPWFLAPKAALATLLAILGNEVLENKDIVSATFIAVLSVSPNILLGLRGGLAQLTGSLTGGLWGVAALLANLELVAGIPLAVGGSILTVFFLRQGPGYPIAAFTALFVQAVPFGTPWETLLVRLEAVAVGALAGFVVNLIVSSRSYPGIYYHRLRQLWKFYEAGLPDRFPPREATLKEFFSYIGELSAEMATARRELSLRRSSKTARLDELLSLCRQMQFLGHLWQDILFRLESEPGLKTSQLEKWPAELAETRQVIRTTTEGINRELAEFSTQKK